MRVFCNCNYYRLLTVRYSMCFNDLALMFVKSYEIIAKNVVYKRVFGLPPFCFYYLFMKLFHIPVKNVKYGLGQK